MYKLITAYTPEYAPEAHALIRSVELQGMNIQTFPYTSWDNWLKNCAQTVTITLDALKHYKHPLVWLDADARLLQYPFLFDTISTFDPDIAVHKRCNRDGNGWHYNSGTIWFAYNPRVIAFLQDQIDRLNAYEGIGPYPYTDWMLRNTPHGLNIYELPLPYSYIEGTEQPEEQIGYGAIVILHTQASRRLSKIVNQETP